MRVAVQARRDRGEAIEAPFIPEASPLIRAA